MQGIVNPQIRNPNVEIRNNLKNQNPKRCVFGSGIAAM